jgi:hypothetical protein
MSLFCIAYLYWDSKEKTNERLYEEKTKIYQEEMLSYEEKIKGQDSIILLLEKKADSLKSISIKAKQIYIKTKLSNEIKTDSIRNLPTDSTLLYLSSKLPSFN